LKETKVEVSSKVEGTGVRVRIIGDVDSETSPALQAEFHRLIDAGTTDVVVDPARITFLSSAGLNILIGAQRGVERFCLERGNRIVDRLIDLTGLEVLYGEESLLPAPQ
jgi:anti-anti-sigma factor